MRDLTIILGVLLGLQTLMLLWFMWWTDRQITTLSLMVKKMASDDANRENRMVMAAQRIERVARGKRF